MPVNGTKVLFKLPSGVEIMRHRGQTVLRESSNLSYRPVTKVEQEILDYYADVLAASELMVDQLEHELWEQRTKSMKRG